MSLHKLSVLIVDDNASDRLIAKAMLEKAGFRSVQEAEDGVIADKKIMTALEIGKPFDLILVDWQMPRENGLGLLKTIRANWKLKATKVVMLSGLADMKLVQNAKQLNVDGFLVKPLSVEALEAQLKKLFKINS
jgi:two-component system chemotaxis response regulator CheY